MLSRMNLLPAVVLLAACATAEGAKTGAKTSETALTDQELDQRRLNLDAKLAARATKVKQSLDKIANYQLKAEKERLDFERYITEERKAFYLFLKSVRADERDKELDRFTEKQENERSVFDKKQLEDQKRWFDEAIEKNWKSETIEFEAAPMPAPKADSKPEPKAEPKQEPRPVHKAVYKKKTKPAVKKKQAEAAPQALQPQAAQPAEPAQAPAAAAPAEPAPSMDSKASAPPPPGN